MHRVVDTISPEVNVIRYDVHRPDGGWRRIFTEEYIRIIRPIAETLAMMDKEVVSRSWENYLQEADAIYRNNGGDTGWASQCSWIAREKSMMEDPSCRDLWNKLQLVLTIKEKV